VKKSLKTILYHPRAGFTWYSKCERSQVGELRLDFEEVAQLAQRSRGSLLGPRASQVLREPREWPRDPVEKKY
jgi:hypothetical protein